MSSLVVVGHYYCPMNCYHVRELYRRLMSPTSVKQTFLSGVSLPCNLAAEAPLEPLTWCLFKATLFTGINIKEHVQHVLLVEEYTSLALISCLRLG